MTHPYNGPYSRPWSLDGPIEPGPAVPARPYPGERVRVVVNEPRPTPAETLAVADDLDDADPDSAFAAQALRDAVAATTTAAPAQRPGLIARLLGRLAR